MKVDGSLKNPIQGVSQQPPRSRLPGQCTEQINMSSNPVDGLTRRPPLNEVAKLFTDSDEAQFYDFDFGGGNQFVAAATPGSIRVFDMTGVEKTVTELGSAFSYIDAGKLAFTTIDNIVYVANRSKVVAMDSAVMSYVQNRSLVYCLGGQYGRIYKLDLVWSGTTISVSYTAPDGGTSSDSTKITSTYIITQLETLLNANATFSGNFTAIRAGDVLEIKKNTAGSFQVTTDDGDGGVNLLVVNNTIKDANRLPRYASHGYVVSITGTASSDADNWYVQFRCEKDAAGNYPAIGAGMGRNGVWEECVGPGVTYKFDMSTMPHVLYYDETLDEFTFGVGAWENREAGDENSNPAVTFVGNTIEDLFYFQGRLGMLSGAAAVMSRTDKPLNFWNQTATAVTDSDPIDVKSTIRGVKKMYRAIPHNRDLVVFSNKGQFIIFGRNQLTPNNAALVLTTTFEADLTATPVAAGRNIFFGIAFGRYTGIREFFTQSSQDQNDSRPITEHVIKYLDGNIKLLTTSSNFNILLVQTVIDESIVYIYEYIWIDDTKAQSSWSKWILPHNVKYTFITQSLISVITRVGNDYILNTIDLDKQDDPGLTYQVHLDRKKIKTNVTNSVSSIYNPMPADPQSVIFIQGDGCPNPGLRAWVDSYSAGTYTFDKSMGGGDIIYGIPYRSSYIPTNPVVKDSDDVKIGTGRLIVSKFFVNLKNTGRLLSRVFSKYYAADKTTTYTARIVGDPNTQIGEPSIAAGKFTVPFRENVEYAEMELWTDSHLPATITDIEWIGQYTKKGRRISGGG